MAAQSDKSQSHFSHRCNKTVKPVAVSIHFISAHPSITDLVARAVADHDGLAAGGTPFTTMLAAGCALEEALDDWRKDNHQPDFVPLPAFMAASLALLLRMIDAADDAPWVDEGPVFERAAAMNDQYRGEV